MKKLDKAELQNLYDETVRPSLQRWRQVANTKNDDFAFLLWATDLILDELDLTDEEIINACQLDGKWDLKIDAGYYDSQENKLYLIQAKHWSPLKAVGMEPFTQISESLDFLSNDKLIKKANKYTKDFYYEFADAIKQHSEVVLCVATSGKILQQQVDYVQCKPSKRQIAIGDDTYEVPVTFRVFGLKDLVDIEKQGDIIDLSKSSAPVTIDLREGWYCVPVDATGKELYDTFYTTVAAEDMTKIRKLMGTDLYTMNYRGPLGDKVAVNREILGSIEQLPEQFHVLNNGLTAICTHFFVDKKDHKVVAQDFKIVNGCQTLETLFRHGEKVIGKSSLRLNVRIVTCQPSQGALVAKATNNQTLLRAEDFATLDPIQQTLKMQFDKMQPPWFYEIKRRYWKNIVATNKSDRQRYTDADGLPRVIKFRDAAQRTLAFLGEPLTAREKTALIFRPETTGGFKEVVFPDILSAHQLLLAWTVYEGVNAQIQQYLSDLEKSAPSQLESYREWMENSRLTVVALVGDGLREHYGFEKRSYPPMKITGALLKSTEDWLGPISKLILDCLLAYVSSNSGWQQSGPRAVFRRSQTYDELYPIFMATFKASKPTLVQKLPKVQ